MLCDALFAYEYYDPLRLRFKEKHLWTKKATGLGVLEFVLRFMGWLFRNYDIRNSQMIVIIGS
jgi:hypothetical protein